MTARMDATREAMDAVWQSIAPNDPLNAKLAAALAEVEEWETRLADAHTRLGQGWGERGDQLLARAEAAEAERDELKRLCEQADADFHTCMDARQALEAERDKLKEALNIIANHTYPATKVDDHTYGVEGDAARFARFALSPDEMEEQ